MAQQAVSDYSDVLIVGGSLVGLSAATFLAWHGVATLSVERHEGTAIHPRAGHFHLRTLEVFRSVGLEALVRTASDTTESGHACSAARTASALGRLATGLVAMIQTALISPRHALANP